MSEADEFPVSIFFAEGAVVIFGRIITKTRYVIPIENGHFVELDIFEGDLAPLVLAEIEFPDEAFAKAYQAPSWLKEDVTYSSEYHNSTLSKKD